jgi:hypothetical protein
MGGAVTTRRSLDDFGILHGTDKSSLNHDYLRHYERILGQLRDEPITLLEIGVFRGGSLSMWEDFLPSGRIVGVDINPECAQYAGGRREVEIGSQADPMLLDDIGRRLNPHVIVDDGSHLADHVILTFRTLFRHLRPGGIYIVEDVHFHAGPGAPHWRGASDTPPQDVLLQLARMVVCPGTAGDGERAWAHQVDGVEFFYGGVAIRKRGTRSREEVAARRALVAQADLPGVWAAYAMHAYNNTLDLPDAVDAIQRAMQIEPRNPEHYEVLGHILDKAGDLRGAIEAAQTAVELHPSDERRRAWWDRLREQASTG